MWSRALGLICVASTYAIPVYARHSFAMFDAEKTKSLAGTVKEFQWTNPYAWIILQVPDDSGRQTQWAVELNGANGSVRWSWHQKTLTPGMLVTVTIHPLRDGTSGGQVLTVTLPDGTQMGGGL